MATTDSSNFEGTLGLSSLWQGNLLGGSLEIMKNRDQLMSAQVKPFLVIDTQWLQFLPLDLSNPPSEEHLLTPHITSWIPKIGIHLCSFVLNPWFPSPAARLVLSRTPPLFLWQRHAASHLKHLLTPALGSSPRGKGRPRRRQWPLRPRSCPWIPAGVSPRAAR